MLSSAGGSPQADGAPADGGPTSAAGAEPAPAAEAAEGGAADAAATHLNAAEAGSKPQGSAQGGTPAKNGRGSANGRERRPKVDVQRIAEVRQDLTVIIAESVSRSELVCQCMPPCIADQIMVFCLFRRFVLAERLQNAVKALQRAKLFMDGKELAFDAMPLATQLFLGNISR